jgi:5-methylcytosine-specific restriction endonuclease McrA
MSKKTQSDSTSLFEDDKSVISDITDANDAETVSSTEILQKLEEIKTRTETELSKLTMDKLREKCKELSITSISTQKKPELVQTLLSEFMKIWQVLKDKKRQELKNICKMCDIKGVALLKKDDMILLILNDCSANLRFKIDDSSPPPPPPPPPLVSVQEEPAPTKTKKLSALEELERQRAEIESKLKEETDRQNKIAEEEQKRKLEEEQKKEKEEAKKKKQAIPKHVRNIVWNHYIGEDIIKHKCLCCKKVSITNTCFEVGHVISETNGGTHEINNLRPICGACNHSMGTENMVDYVVKYGLFIG